MRDPVRGRPANQGWHTSVPDPEKGDEIGSPKELAERDLDWDSHPTEEDAQVHSFEAIWHGVLPGQVLRVVILRRPHLKDADSSKKRKRYLEVFFTIDLRFDAEQILEEYQGRWSIDPDRRRDGRHGKASALERTAAARPKRSRGPITSVS